MEILPATVPRPILQLRRDHGVLARPNPRLQWTSWEAIVPRATSKEGAFILSEKCSICFLRNELYPSGERSYAQFQTKNHRSLSFFVLPFLVGGRRSSTLGKVRRSSLPRTFPELPPLFILFTIESSSINGALAKLRPPKMSFQNKNANCSGGLRAHILRVS